MESCATPAHQALLSRAPDFKIRALTLRDKRDERAHPAALDAAQHGALHSLPGCQPARLRQRTQALADRKAHAWLRILQQADAELRGRVGKCCIAAAPDQRLQPRPCCLSVDACCLCTACMYNCL